MTDENKGAAIVLAFGIFLGINIGLVSGAYIKKCEWRRDAIKHNAAQYNPTNGTFEWKESK